MAAAEERLRHFQLPKEALADISTAVKKHRFCDEVHLGLKLLTPGQVRNLLLDGALQRRIDVGWNADEAMMREFEKANPEVEAIVRALRQGGSKDADASRSRHRKHKHVSRSRQRSRSRSGHRRGDAQGSRAEPSASRDGRAVLRQYSSNTAEAAAPPRSAKGPPAAPSRAPAAGVWAAPEPRPPREDGAGFSLEEWLRSLDQGRGTMCQYLEPLQRESLTVPEALLAAVQESTSAQQSVVSRIDTSLWEILGVQKFGHKLLLARGIIALFDGP